jgi:hypothetical protein
VIDFSTPAGGRSRDEELHPWTLNDHQQVTRLRHYVDTAKHIAAFAGEDTTWRQRLAGRMPSGQAGVTGLGPLRCSTPLLRG